MGLRDQRDLRDLRDFFLLSNFITTKNPDDEIRKCKISPASPAGPAEFRCHCELLNFRRHGEYQNAGVTIAGGIIDNEMGILSTVSCGQNSTVTISAGQN